MKAEWNKQEDLIIFTNVIENGLKWNEIAKLCNEKTPKRVEIRFFHLISQYFMVPVSKIKSSTFYLNQNNLEEIRKSIKESG